MIGNICCMVKKPEVDIPLAFSGALVLVVLTYALPMAAAVSLIPVSRYAPDMFYAAAAVISPTLYSLVLVSAFFCLVGLGISFCATTSEAIA